MADPNGGSPEVVTSADDAVASGPATSLPPALPNVPQGEAARYSQADVRTHIDGVIRDYLRLRFVSIQRGKIVVSALDPISTDAVRSRLEGAYVLLRHAAPNSPPIHQALMDTDGIALHE